MAKSDKVFVTIDDETVELTGKDKDALIAQREADAAEFARVQAENKNAIL